MLNILEEIRECFASTQKGARILKSISTKYPAIVIRIVDGYGVAVPFKDDRAISEKFANAKIFSKRISIDGIEQNYLILSCCLDSLRYEFATVCAQFVEPGIDGIDRINLIKDPLEWWKQWKMLLGNSISDKKPYSVIAEMLVLETLYKDNKNIEWMAVDAGSHDFESDTESYEVKSTIKRYGSTITISGQHQLINSKKLHLYFCRLEKSNLGVSINDMKDILIRAGYNGEKLEQQLFNLGYEFGTSVRNARYKVLEKRKYEVDDDFPKITKKSFKDGKIPESIVQITYTIDLDGIKYIEW